MRSLKTSASLLYSSAGSSSTSRCREDESLPALSLFNSSSETGLVTNVVWNGMVFWNDESEKSWKRSCPFLNDSIIQLFSAGHISATRFREHIFRSLVPLTMEKFVY